MYVCTKHCQMNMYCSTRRAATKSFWWVGKLKSFLKMRNVASCARCTKLCNPKVLATLFAWAYSSPPSLGFLVSLFLIYGWQCWTCKILDSNNGTYNVNFSGKNISAIHQFKVQTLSKRIIKQNLKCKLYTTQIRLVVP